MWIWCDRKKRGVALKRISGRKVSNNNVLGFREKATRTSPWDRSVLAPRVWMGPVDSSQMAGEASPKVKRVCRKWGRVEWRDDAEVTASSWEEVTVTLYEIRYRPWCRCTLGKKADCTSTHKHKTSIPLRYQLREKGPLTPVCKQFFFSYILKISTININS